MYVLQVSAINTESKDVNSPTKLVPHTKDQRRLKKKHRKTIEKVTLAASPNEINTSHQICLVCHPNQIISIEESN